MCLKATTESKRGYDWMVLNLYTMPDWLDSTSAQHLSKPEGQSWARVRPELD